MAEPQDEDGVDTDSPKMKLLKRFAIQLGEHFDSARIVVTYTEGTTTHCLTAGAGNWYAQFGSMKLWVTEKENSMSEVNEPDEES